MRTIRNFLLTQMPETIEADEDDDGVRKKEPIAKVFSTWSLEAITAALQHDKLAEGSKKHTNSAAMDAAKDIRCGALTIMRSKVVRAKQETFRHTRSLRRKARPFRLPPRCLHPVKTTRQGRKLLFITADSRRSRQKHGSISCAMKGSRMIFEPRDLNPSQHKGKSFGGSFSDAWNN